MAKQHTFDPAWLEAHRVTLPPVPRTAIVGLTHVMSEIGSLVARLHDVEGAARLGALPPRGLLFWGPAGTGKTLVGRYVAGILGDNVPMYEVSSDELTPDRLRGMLRHLAAVHPTSVVFWDEIDQWAMHRDLPAYASAGTRLVLTAALAALDGLVPAAGPIVIAASNRGPAQLDPALIRPGRLGVHVRFDLPDEDDREELLRRALAVRPIADGIDLPRLARLSRRLTPAAIAALVDDAAGLTLARGGDRITADDLVAAIRRGGEIVPEEEHEDADRRRRPAVHEAGHVAVAVALRGPAYVYAVRIGARGGRTEGGSDRPGRGNLPDDELRDAIAISMGGIAAERLILGEPSLGSAEDVEHATGLALGRLTAGIDPGFPPVSLDALHPHIGDGLRDLVAERVTDRLVLASEIAATAVRDAQGAIVRFAEILDASGELVGEELAAAIDAAGLRGPERAG